MISLISEKIYRLVALIPAGQVATYGEIARNVGTSPRVVGNALHKNPNPEKIPCHRVVNSRGKLSASFAFGGIDGQRRKLSSEGVSVVNYVLVNCKERNGQGKIQLRRS